jgi:hypothetical protein
VLLNQSLYCCFRFHCLCGAKLLLRIDSVQSASKEIPIIYETQNIITVFVITATDVCRELDEFNPHSHMLLFMIHSNILLPSTARSSKCSLPCKFSDQNLFQAALNAKTYVNLSITRNSYRRKLIAMQEHNSSV